MYECFVTVTMFYLWPIARGRGEWMQVEINFWQCRWVYNRWCTCRIGCITPSLGKPLPPPLSPATPGTPPHQPLTGVCPWFLPKQSGNPTRNAPGVRIIMAVCNENKINYMAHSLWHTWHTCTTSAPSSGRCLRCNSTEYASKIWERAITQRFELWEHDIKQLMLMLDYPILITYSTSLLQVQVATGQWASLRYFLKSRFCKTYAWQDYLMHRTTSCTVLPHVQYNLIQYYIMYSTTSSIQYYLTCNTTSCTVVSHVQYYLVYSNTSFTILPHVQYYLTYSTASCTVMHHVQYYLMYSNTSCTVLPHV